MQDINLLEKKAELLLAGSIVLDRSVKLSFPLSRSSAGPEVGSRTIILDIGGIRVKLRAVREGGENAFRLVSNPSPGDNTSAGARDRYSIVKGSEIFIENVSPERTPVHAPGQAFINIDANCRYHCLFCASPDLKGYERISNERWISLIRKFADAGDITSIAVTSGIPGSLEKNIDDFVNILEGVSDLGLTMGVEPYVTERDQLQRLYEAGARELKVNIQSWDPAIFGIICPGIDQEKIREMLEHGVGIFGRNNVCSNLIIGLGETDDSVLEGIEHLARMGVAVNLRRLHLNDANEDRLKQALDIEPVTRERYLGLREKQKEIFSHHGIDTDRFRTMCFPCGACDLDV